MAALLPMLSPPAAVLHTENRQPRGHPAPGHRACSTANRIKAGTSFDFYAEASPRVAAVLAAADADALRVARAYGVATPTLPGWIAAAYGHRADTVETAVGGRPGLCRHQGPDHPRTSLLARRRCRRAWSPVELGRAAGLALPTLAEARRSGPRAAARRRTVAAPAPSTHSVWKA